MVFVFLVTAEHSGVDYPPLSTVLAFGIVFVVGRIGIAFYRAQVSTT